MVLESEIRQKRCAQRMNISSREGTAESQLHVEVTPAFSGGDSWCYGEIISSERAGSDRCAKGEETGQNIVSVFFVSAQKAVLDQQEGIVANTLGRILPASLFIRGEPPKSTGSSLPESVPIPFQRRRLSDFRHHWKDAANFDRIGIVL